MEAEKKEKNIQLGSPLIEEGGEEEIALDGHEEGLYAYVTSTGLPSQVLAAGAYFFGWIGALLVLLLETRNKFALFHAWQSLFVSIFFSGLMLIFVWTWIGFVLVFFLYLVTMAFFIIRVVLDNSTQTLFKLPLIGDFCERKAKNKASLMAPMSSSIMFDT